MKGILPLLLLVCTLAATAQKVTQAWSQGRFGYASIIKTDPSGNVYVGGVTTATASDIILTKYSPAGAVLWSIQYDGDYNLKDMLFGMTVDGAGNIYLTGRTYNSTTQTNSYITKTRKYSSTRSLVWSTDYGLPALGSGPTDITVDGSGNVYVVGHKGTMPYNDQYPVLVKLDASGVFQWEQTVGIGTALLGQHVGVVQDNNGNIYVAGVQPTNPSFGSNSLTTFKYNAAGTLLWQQPYTIANRQVQAKAIKLDINGDILVAGISGGSGFFGYTFGIAYVKYSPAGTQLLSAAIADVGATGPAIGGNVFLATDVAGNVYLASTSTDKGSVRHNNILIAQYSVTGRRNWLVEYNHSGTSNEGVVGVAADFFNNVYVTGYTGADYLTMKYTTAGAKVWSKLFNSPANGSDYAAGIALFHAGSPRAGFQIPSVYVTGNTTGGIIYTVKYEQLPGTASVLDETPSPVFAFNAFPNPARGAATVQYTLPEDAKVQMVLRDVSGKIVKVLRNASQAAGAYTSIVEMGHIASGIYHLQLEATSGKRQWKQVKQLVFE